MDTISPQAAAKFPLPTADLDSLGFRREQIDRLIALISRHIAEGKYPGAQIALARRGKLALDRKSTRLNSSHMSESRMPSSA